MNNLGLSYHYLNAEEQNAYTIIYDALIKQQTSCDISRVKRSVDLMKVLLCVLGDNPSIIYFNKTMLRVMGGLFSKQMSFSGCLNKRQTEKMNQELKQALEDAVWEIDKQAKNDKDILRGITEYLQRTAVYDRDEFNSAMRGKSRNPMAHNAYGALVQNKAVCDGFASAYALIAQYFGFRCMVVNGTSAFRSNPKVEHSWNIIEYDGNFYHIDATWDENAYEVTSEYSYDYFGLTDDEVSLDHDWDYKMTPKCNGNGLSYYIDNGLYANSESQIEEIICRCLKRKDMIIRLKVSPGISLGSDENDYISCVLNKSASRLALCISYSYMWEPATRCLFIKIGD